jgi:PIN domain nuclease of toxin-antitoxin system
VRLLLDSHVLVWWLDAAAELPMDARHEIDDALEAPAVSAASVWELEIKRASGKLRITDTWLAAVTGQALPLLDITTEDAQAAAALPLLHRDPFDRMLVAQAARRGLTLMTADRRLVDYPVSVRLVR